MTWGWALFLWATAASADDLTLAEALDHALIHNLELDQARMDRRDAVLALQSAAGAFDPVLFLGTSFGGARTPTNENIDGADYVNSSTTSWNMSLVQPLPTGGSVSANWSESISRSDSANAVDPAFAFENLSLGFSHEVLGGAGTVVGMSGILAARIGATALSLDCGPAP